jgi:hypothetical protein
MARPFGDDLLDFVGLKSGNRLSDEARVPETIPVGDGGGGDPPEPPNFELPTQATDALTAHLPDQAQVPEWLL